MGYNNPGEVIRKSGPRCLVRAAQIIGQVLELRLQQREERAERSFAAVVHPRFAGRRHDRHRRGQGEGSLLWVRIEEFEAEIIAFCKTIVAVEA